MARGQANKRDNIPTTDTKKPQEIDTLSPVDRGFDFIKPGETAQVGRESKA